MSQAKRALNHLRMRRKLYPTALMTALIWSPCLPLRKFRPKWPSDLLKLYIYGYLNRVQSSRRLERETGREC